MIAFLGNLMEQLINSVKDGKTPSFCFWSFATLVVVIGFVSWQGLLWANGEHKDLVSKSEFTEFAEESELRDASQTIRLLSIDLRIAKATGASEKEIDDIEKEGNRWRNFKECKRTNGPNCETLKEPE